MRSKIRPQSIAPKPQRPHPIAYQTHPFRLVHHRDNWRLTTTSVKVTRYRSEYLAMKQLRALQEWRGAGHTLVWRLEKWNGRRHVLLASSAPEGGAR